MSIPQVMAISGHKTVGQLFDMFNFRYPFLLEKKMIFFKDKLEIFSLFFPANSLSPCILLPLSIMSAKWFSSMSKT